MMKADELDGAYTALCESMARVGEAGAPQFLAMVSLSLMARMNDAPTVMKLIAQAETTCRKDAP
jgi:hypothetical protein